MPEKKNIHELETTSFKMKLSSGDETAFAKLYDVHGTSMLRVAHMILKNSDDAHDVVQDVFVSLAKYRKNLLNTKNLKVYIFSMLRNEAYRMSKDKQKHKKLIMESQKDRLAEEHVHESSQNHDIEHYFSNLSLDHSEVLSLKIVEGMTFKEISQVLNINLNTIASRYRSAIEKVRTIMGKEHD